MGMASAPALRGAVSGNSLLPRLVLPRIATQRKLSRAWGVFWDPHTAAGVCRYAFLSTTPSKQWLVQCGIGPHTQSGRVTLRHVIVAVAHHV